MNMQRDVQSTDPSENSESIEQVDSVVDKQAALMHAGADYARLTQACIDARLIQRLRDKFDKYEDQEAGVTQKSRETGIIGILQQYAKEIKRQSYRSCILVEEVLKVMDNLAKKLRDLETEIKIAAEIVRLGICIYNLYVEPWYSGSDYELYLEAGFTDRARNIVTNLFEVCFSVAHNGVKYRHKDVLFAEATAVLAKILGTLQSAPEPEKKEIFLYINSRSGKSLDKRYAELKNSIQESELCDCVKKKLMELHGLLQERFDKTKRSERSSIEKSIRDLKYASLLPLMAELECYSS